MEKALIIRGTVVDRAFVPDEPLPNIEGRAELIIHVETAPPADPKTPSIFDVIGKAPRLRSAEDIDAQLRAERDSWDDE
jgi:hypothetical protein